MRHANISIFVPHLGCPHQCSFCNQKHITGSAIQPDKAIIDKALADAKTSPKYDPRFTEIAFFGGSFTAIERSYMISLLSAAKVYIDKGDVTGIRISTRPDCINEEMLKILKSYGVTAIELGAQSMCDDVLKISNRGHSSKDVVLASKLIKDFGFELGLQMMTGLLGDTDEKSVFTAEKIIALSPSTVRIYPTIVLKNTDLEDLYLKGEYIPQTLNEAVKLCTKLSAMFEKAGIKVIRLGLHSIDNESYVAGPWHPAFAELCESAKYLDILKNLLKFPGKYEVFVKDTELSKAIGQNKSNINELSALGYEVKFIPDISTEKYYPTVKEVK